MMRKGLYYVGDLSNVLNDKQWAEVINNHYFNGEYILKDGTRIFNYYATVYKSVSPENQSNLIDNHAAILKDNNAHEYESYSYSLGGVCITSEKIKTHIDSKYLVRNFPHHFFTALDDNVIRIDTLRIKI